MTVDTVLTLVASVIFGMIGVIYFNLKQAIESAEKRINKRIDAIDQKLMDTDQNIRHRVENINQQLVASIQHDRREDIGKFVDGFETLAKLLERRATAAIIDSDAEKRSQQ